MKILKFIVLLVVFTGCKSLKNTGSEDSDNSYFHGTIYYQIDLIGATPSADLSKIRAKYGYVMALTVYEDGNIKRTYFDALDNGLQSIFLNVKDNKLKVELKSSEDIVVDAASVDVTKLSGLRPEKNEATIMGYDLDQYGFVAEEVDIVDGEKKQVIVNYLYNQNLKLDKSLYTNVSYDLWNTYVSKSGSIYLKKVQDYYDYKISYTAFDIQEGIYEARRGTAEPALSE